MDKLSNPTLKARIEELERQNSILKATLNKTEEDRLVFLNQTLNAMGDPVFVKDAESRLLLVNDAFCEIFHLARQDVIGKTLAEHVPPEERESFLAIDRQVIADGVENINEESLTVEGHSPHIISTRKSRFIDGDGKRYLVGIIRDITDRYKAMMALEESQAKLKELNKTKDKMFSIISHDLRSPMASLLGLSELIADDDVDLDEGERKKYFELIFQSIKDTNQLLNNLLGWARSQTGALKVESSDFLLHTAVDEVVQLLHSAASVKGIRLESKVPAHLELSTDRNIFETLLRNLISNAIKFTESGGSIKVMAYEEGPYTRIGVRDTGIGMSEEQRAGLFQLSTTHSTRGTADEKGSGLGLLLCKELVEKLGGCISVSSRPGEGSEFSFKLPN